MFLDWAQKRFSLCVQNDIPDPFWIVRRFDNIADEALRFFYTEAADFGSWPQIIDALSDCALAAIGTRTTDRVRAELTKLRYQWLKNAKTRADTASIPERGGTSAAPINDFLKK
jgi:hypothetical protein